MTPKNGPYNMSGTWGGVFGGVINKEFDMGLNSWHWMTSRYSLVQFAPIDKESFVLVWTPNNPKIDYGLFTRELNSM